MFESVTVNQELRYSITKEGGNSKEKVVDSLMSSDSTLEFIIRKKATWK